MKAHTHTHDIWLCPVLVDQSKHKAGMMSVLTEAVVITSCFILSVDGNLVMQPNTQQPA